MAATRSIFDLSKLGLLILASTLVTSALGCSQPDGEEADDNVELAIKVSNSDVVVLGTVVTVTHDESKVAQGWNVSTVEFAVHCVFKGAPVRSRLVIKDAGIIPGMCFNTYLKLGENYVVYLKKSGNDFTQSGVTANDGITAYVDEILINCEVDLTYPSDMAESHNKSTLCVATDHEAVVKHKIDHCPQIESEDSFQPTTEYQPITNKPSVIEEKKEVNENIPEPEQDNQVEAGAAIETSKDGESSATTNYISMFGLVYILSVVFYL